ncbi:MAG: hypothetical protein MUP98_16940 [Candidatus Aminicenantes bacterium]|nr:hypothetical protein [Candidatus Aminicenantes bacterium]
MIEKGAPIFADISAVILYLIFLPRLITFFQKKSLLNGLFVGAIYLIFCVSVVIIRKLPNPADQKTVYSKGWMGFFGINFGIFVTYIMAETSGFFDLLDNMPGTLKGITAAAVMGGVILWLILAFLYMIVLIVNIKPVLPRKKFSTWIIELTALLGVNVMILTTVGFWNAYFFDTEPYVGLATGGKILIFLLTYIFFMLYFAAPRMLFLLKRPGAAGIITFILQTGYYVWNLLSGTAWE